MGAAHKLPADRSGPAPFGLTEAERQGIARVTFAKVDVLQESLDKVLHASAARVRETVDFLAADLEEQLASRIRSSGGMPDRLPALVRAELHNAVYTAVSAQALQTHSKEIGELIAEVLRTVDKSQGEERHGI